MIQWKITSIVNPLVIGIVASAIVAYTTYEIGSSNGYSDGKKEGIAEGRLEVLNQESEEIRKTLEKMIRDELEPVILEEKCKRKIALVQQEWDAKLTQAEKDCNARISTTRTEAYDKGFVNAEQQNFILEFLDWYQRILQQTSEVASVALEDPNADLQQMVNSAAQAIIANIDQQRDFEQEYAKILNGELDKLRAALKNKDYKSVNEIMVALAKAIEIRRKAIIQKIKELQAQWLKKTYRGS